MNVNLFNYLQANIKKTKNGADQTFTEIFTLYWSREEVEASNLDLFVVFFLLSYNPSSQTYQQKFIKSISFISSDILLFNMNCYKEKRKGRSPEDF